MSACATTPDPAVICTSEWIKPRADRATSELKRDISGRLRTIRSAASNFEAGEGLSPFQSWRLLNAAKGLVSDIETSQALKDLKTLSSTCNDPEIAKKAFTGMMESSGVSEKVLEFFDIFETLFPDGFEHSTPDNP